MAAPGSPEKLSIVVFSGDFDRIHYALVMASGAVASNTEVTLFFTMWAARALTRNDGWKALPVSGNEAENGAALDAQFKERGTATFEELLSACIALGVKVMVCEMGLKALGMPMEALREDVPIAPGGVVTFLADASKDGGMLFI